MAGADRRASRRRRRSSPTWSTAATSTRPTRRRSAAGSSSSTSTWPTRSRPQPSALASAVLDEFTGFASGRLGPGAAPGDPLHRAPRTWPPPGRSSPPRPRWCGCSSTTAPGSAGPGDIQSTYSADFSSWPPAGTVETLYFGRNGSLQRSRPRRSRRAPPSPWTRVSRPATSLPPSGNAWAADPGLGLDDRPRRRRDRLPDRSVHDGHHHRGSGHPRSLGQVGHARSRTSRPPSPRSDRPPAQEEYVTSGFLRSSNQVDLPDSTSLFTDPTYLGSRRPKPVAERTTRW